MAFTVDEINVLIKAQTSDLTKQLDVANKKLDSFASTASKAGAKLSAVTIATGNILAKIVSSVFSAVVSHMDDAISRLDTINNFPNVMSNLGIGAAESSKSIAYLSEKLQGLPTTLDDAALSVQRFTSANGNLGASTQMFLAVNNAILAGGTSMEIQSTALEQLSQAYAKGKPDMMEWRSLLTAMPAQLNQVATAMGYASSNDLGEALRNGEISMNDFMATIVKLNKEGANGFLSFEDQARNATGGVSTAIANLKTAITRGLTTIMDVIGQSNIAGFFNAVASAIGTAANYVAAFVKVVLTAINALRALFGQSAISWGSSTNNANDTAEAVSGISSAADDATDSIGGTTAAAKKLKKQLASFDEMNVLTEQDNSSGGSGGGGSSSGVADLGNLDGLKFDFDNDFEAAADRITGIANGLMYALSTIFDFSAIGNAIKRFWEDIVAAAQPIGEVIGDVWNTYLKPLVSWAGNSLLPAVLNAIGGAIRFVGEVIKSFWNTYLKPFVDAFLVPIAKWTGGKIVSILNKLGDSLRKLSQNERAVKNVSTILAAIATTIAGIKMAKFASEISTAITVFNKAHGAGLALNTVFSAISGETTGLVSVLSGLAGNLTGRVMSAINSVKSGVQLLWTTLSAHPIAAIIAIVGALLLTNENFRKSLGDLLNAVLAPLGTMLSNLMACIEPLISTLTNLLTIVLAPIMGIIQVIAEVLSVVFNALTPIISVVMQVSAALSPLNLLLQVLKPVLEFIAGILEPIANGISWLTGLFGGNASAASGAADASKDLSDAQDDVAKSADGATSSLEAEKVAIEDVHNAELAAKDAQLQVMQQTKTATEKRNKYNEMLAEGTYTQEELTEAELEAEIAERRLITQLDSLNDSLKDEIKTASEHHNSDLEYIKNSVKKQMQTKIEQQQYEDVANSLSDLTFASEEYTTESGENYRLTTEEAKKMAAEINEQLESESNGYKNTVDEISKYSGNFRTMMEQWKNSAESTFKDSEMQGYYFVQGIANGMIKNKAIIENAARVLSDAGYTAYNKFQIIKSPSKLMMKSGKYTAEGVATGMEKGSSMVSKAAEGLAAISEDAFGNLQLNTDISKFKLPSASSIGGSVLLKSGLSISGLADEIVDKISVPVHNVFKIGEDTIIDKIVEGINDKSTLENRAVLAF